MTVGKDDGCWEICSENVFSSNFNLDLLNDNIKHIISYHERYNYILLNRFMRNT